MIEVILSGGFHHGKTWDVDDLASVLSIPVMVPRDDGPPALTWARYQWRGVERLGVPVMEHENGPTSS